MILLLINLTWIILLSFTLPSWIMVVVLIISKTIFSAVPHFIRVLPVMNSGPVMISTGRSACSEIGENGLLTMQPVVILFSLHFLSAANTNGVVPLAEMPTTISSQEIFRA